jgi:hypothetical protein
VGDLVLVAAKHIHTIRVSKKLANRNIGPFKVLECNNPRIVTKTATRLEQEDTVARMQRTRWPEIDGYKGVLQTL